MNRTQPDCSAAPLEILQLNEMEIMLCGDITIIKWHSFYLITRKCQGINIELLYY